MSRRTSNPNSSPPVAAAVTRPQTKRVVRSSPSARTTASSTSPELLNLMEGSRPSSSEKEAEVNLGAIGDEKRVWMIKVEMLIRLCLYFHRVR